MGKVITAAFAKRMPIGHFNGKYAIIQTEEKNIGGETIEKGALVFITGRGRDKSEFNIRKVNTNIYIHNVYCESLELVDNLIIELEDNGQDFTKIVTDMDGKIVETKPFQTEVWKGGIISIDFAFLAIGKELPIHHPPKIYYGFLKHKIIDIKYQ